MTDEKRLAEIADDITWGEKDLAAYIADGDKRSEKDQREILADLRAERALIADGTPMPADDRNQGIHGSDPRYRLA